MTPLAPTLRLWLGDGEPTVLVTLAEARGSTPREAGVHMLVTAGASRGTIGGGRMEWDAIAAARALIIAKERSRRVEIPLGPAIGQCCGGFVAIDLELADGAILARIEAEEANEAATCPSVLIFGAGHVGKALVRALAPLPLKIQWIDGRADEFPAEIPETITRRLTPTPTDVIAEAPPGAAYLVMTHSHAMDFDVTEAALRRGDAAYVGLIGSATKRERFERWFRARGNDPRRAGFLTCPIGAGLGRDKRPSVIAAMVAAELLVAFAKAKDRPAPADKPAAGAAPEQEAAWTATRGPAPRGSNSAASPRASRASSRTTA
ncbi:xanthine dehydrogenase accessory protein XdhC [Inquilinus limosus]|uniref:xanthine dehydrogenase accessory protein XdhC n=1 Tax=Inquilinus limosus TaxID=171674 RepID=UPI00040027A6|nr:xanthine dehydrogenase accessory protein XdhC [Inquilinus limosus]